VDPLTARLRLIRRADRRVLAVARDGSMQRIGNYAATPEELAALGVSSATA